MKYILISLLFLFGCSKEECADRDKSDAYYCYCNQKECNSSNHEPIDWNNL